MRGVGNHASTTAAADGDRDRTYAAICTRGRGLLAWQLRRAIPIGEIRTGTGVAYVCSEVPTCRAAAFAVMVVITVIARFFGRLVNSTFTFECVVAVVIVVVMVVIVLAVVVNG